MLPLPSIFPGASSSPPWIKTATTEVRRCSSLTQPVCLCTPNMQYYSLMRHFFPSDFLLSEFTSFFFLSPFFYDLQA
jgi:hypothetical protein